MDGDWEHWHPKALLRDASSEWFFIESQGDWPASASLQNTGSERGLYTHRPDGIGVENSLNVPDDVFVTAFRKLVAEDSLSLAEMKALSHFPNVYVERSPAMVHLNGVEPLRRAIASTDRYPAWSYIYVQVRGALSLPLTTPSVTLINPRSGEIIPRRSRRLLRLLHVVTQRGDEYNLIFAEPLPVGGGSVIPYLRGPKEPLEVVRVLMDAEKALSVSLGLGAPMWIPRADRGLYTRQTARPGRTQLVSKTVYSHSSSGNFEPQAAALSFKDRLKADVDYVNSHDTPLSQDESFPYEGYLFTESPTTRGFLIPISSWFDHYNLNS